VWYVQWVGLPRDDDDDNRVSIDAEIRYYKPRVNPSTCDARSSRKQKNRDFLQSRAIINSSI